MLDIAQIELKAAAEVARTTPARRAPNGIRYADYGDTQLAAADLEAIVQSVPAAIAAALERKTYYFVPLALAESIEADPNDELGGETDPRKIMIASEFSTELGDAAICHRNAEIAGAECIFISTRLMQDRFSLAFELYINVGHHFVDTAGVPESFMNLAWSQAVAGVRGETSQDAWDHRARALGQPNLEAGSADADSGWQPQFQGSSRPQNRTQTRGRRIASLEASSGPAISVQRVAVDERARTEYFQAVFADAIAIYLLSLTVDFDYTELREREYPLLAASALADRLRHVAQIFPPNAGNEFSVRYRRRNG